LRLQIRGANGLSGNGDLPIAAALLQPTLSPVAFPHGEELLPPPQPAIDTINTRSTSAAA
jgi:hypothetical protein